MDKPIINYPIQPSGYCGGPDGGTGWEDYLNCEYEEYCEFHDGLPQLSFQEFLDEDVFRSPLEGARVLVATLRSQLRGMERVVNDMNVENQKLSDALNHITEETRKRKTELIRKIRLQIIDWEGELEWFETHEPQDHLDTIERLKANITYGESQIDEASDWLYKYNKETGYDVHPN